MAPRADEVAAPRLDHFSGSHNLMFRWLAGKPLIAACGLPVNPDLLASFREHPDTRLHPLTALSSMAFSVKAAWF